MPDYMGLPLTKEEIWRFVGNYIDHESEAGISAHIANKLSKGLYTVDFSERDRVLFRKLGLPEWFDVFAKNVRHLFPLSHCIAYAYLDLIEGWRITQNGGLS